MERPTATRAGAALLALLLASAASAPASADDAIRVPLVAMNGSGENGVAILTPRGGKTLVQLQVHGGSGDPQPAHFHTGTCDKYAPRPLYMLAAVVKGESTTTVDVPIEKLTAGDLVVNVHKSFNDIATIASCAVAKK
ncbi:MAG: hypothetical protein QOF71_3499 [Candidatus Eremiobacteraeota bacterium]|jgi:hypothetical protein|nr:hypothetical protein [Candidatus Eremiobacteraeota bacterium]